MQNSVTCLLGALLCVCLFNACASSPRSNKYNTKISIECRVLSAVEEEDVDFTDVPLTTSYVWVEVISPDAVKASRTRLILLRAPISKPRIQAGEFWKPIGEHCRVEVFYNINSQELYLVPTKGR